MKIAESLEFLVDDNIWSLSCFYLLVNESMWVSHKKVSIQTGSCGIAHHYKKTKKRITPPIFGHSGMPSLLIHVFDCEMKNMATEQTYER